MSISYIEKEKLERLFSTFRNNFRITRLYATYLERFPDIITADIVNELASEGLKTESGIAALLSEIFGLNTDDAEDKALYRNYIIPSIRILDAKRYTENPYYKRVKLPDVKDGDWEFKNEIYPAYRGVICDDIAIESDFSEIPPLGFFEEDFHFPAVLEGGNEWMTLTPVDLDTSDAAIEAAHGKVVTFGLGLGYYAFMVSEKASVESITVIEKSEKVIELFKKYVLPCFSHPEKVRIVCADAFEYAEAEMPREKYDYAFVDTWRDASDGAPMYEKMKALEPLSPATEFSYWIENFLRSRLRAELIEKYMRLYDEGKLDKSYSDILSELNSI
jgi:hypothetical protein